MTRAKGRLSRSHTLGHCGQHINFHFIIKIQNVTPLSSLNYILIAEKDELIIGQSQSGSYNRSTNIDKEKNLNSQRTKLKIIIRQKEKEWITDAAGAEELE